ncbi:MAG: hypothetical protein JXR95_01625 [Deltaproteobacteria bacterium]|nr:hypothetical protein [Deltaproteobacteria bacterium]
MNRGFLILKLGILTVVFLTAGCSNRKHKVAQQNNDLVGIHRECVKMLKDAGKVKSDPKAFLKKAEDIVKSADKLVKSAGKMDLEPELQKVRTHLVNTLSSLSQGYENAITLYKNDQKVKSQQEFAKTENEFHENTVKLIRMQKEVATHMKFTVKPPPKGATVKKEPEGKSPEKPKNTVMKSSVPEEMKPTTETPEKSMERVENKTSPMN